MSKTRTIAVAFACSMLASAALPLCAADTATKDVNPSAQSQPSKAQDKPKPKSTRQAKKPKKNEPAASTNAQPAQSDQPRAAPQDTADCTVETIAETGPVTYTVPIPVPGSKQRIASCLMPAKQAVALQKKGSLFVVDVRTPADFERYRIPGAMNIPLSFVKTKAFLKAQPFVLVDESAGTAELEGVCQQLREAGFKQAAVLRGGFLGWRKASGAIEGDLLAQRELNRMTPAEFAEEGAYADWLVVSVARTPQDEVTKFLPKAVTLPHPADDLGFAEALKSAVAKRARKGAELTVVVVDDDGRRIEKLESLVPAGIATAVVFLEGGLAGYRKFWSEQAAIWAAADRGPKRPRCGA